MSLRASVCGARRTPLQNLPNMDREFKHENRDPVVTVFCYSAIKRFQNFFFKENQLHQQNVVEHLAGQQKILCTSCGVDWPVSKKY